MKKTLRKQMKETLKQYFSSQDIHAISKSVCEKLYDSDFYKNADVVLSFITGKLEIDTSSINEKALKEKILAVPKVVSDTQIEFFVLDKSKNIDEQLDVGAFDIREPKENLKKIDFLSIDSSIYSAGLVQTTLEVTEHLFVRKNILVIVPGIAFTENGKRCGHGKGYYDRFLPKLKDCGAEIKTVGLCLPCQIVEDLPTDKYDIFMDTVIF